MRRPLAEATRAAELVVDLLREGCERIEIAGSIRRGVADVKDVEIVCEPKLGRGLFQEITFDLLNEVVMRRRREKKIQWRTRNGGLGAAEPDNLMDRKYYALATVEAWPWPIDVFAVRPPAQWGAIMAIRTGPAEYSQRLVTHARTRHLRCVDGRLVSAGHEAVEVATPEERDFIEACGMRYEHPGARR